MQTLGPIASIFVMLLAGVLLRRGGILRQADNAVINNIIVFGTVPALAFSTTYGERLTWDLMTVVVGGNAATFVILLVAAGIASLMRLSAPQTGGFVLGSGYGNSTYLGLPVIAAAFDGSPSALLVALIYSGFCQALPAYTVGLVIASRYGGRSVGVLEAIAPHRMPIIPALALGLMLSPFTLPRPFLAGIETLGSATTPLAMISVGMLLSFTSIRGRPGTVVMMGLLKMVCLPAVAYAILAGLGAKGETLQATVVQAGMPTSILAGVITARGGSDGVLVANATAVLTLASLLTLPVVIMLLR